MSKPDDFDRILEAFKDDFKDDPADVELLERVFAMTDEEVQAELVKQWASDGLTLEEGRERMRTAIDRALTAAIPTTPEAVAAAEAEIDQISEPLPDHLKDPPTSFRKPRRQP